MRRLVGAGVRPTRRAALVVGVVGVATIVLDAGELFVILVSLGVVVTFLVDAVLVSRGDPDVSRELPEWLALRARGPLRVTALDRVDVRVARLRQATPPALVATPDVVTGSELRGTILGRHRGIHEVGPPVLRLRGPLGLASRDLRRGPEGTVRVVPDLPRARALAAARRSGGLEDGRVRNRLGVGTEFETIRDYSTDDDIRQVNWVTSARAGRLMSNVYRVDENRDLLCLIDTGRLMASPVGELTRLDVALDAMTVLCVEAEESQDRVGAIAFAEQIRRQLSPRRNGARHIVDALYDLEPREVESDYERAFTAVGRHKRALLVIFTDLVDESASRSLLEACPVLARRHSVMVASCRDDDLDHALATTPDVPHGPLRAVVAADLIEAKDRVIAQLRAVGVTVVEARGDQLGSACVRAYLRLKAKGRA